MKKFVDPQNRMPSDDSCLYKDKASDIPKYPSLQQDIQTNVCIIGGGFTGLMTAYYLSQAGYNPILIERHRIGWGASGRNSGQLIPGFNRDIRYVAKSYGEELAKDSYEATFAALTNIKKLIKTHKIDCDLREGLIIAAKSNKAFADLKGHKEYVKNLCDYETTVLNKETAAKNIGTDQYVGGLQDMNAARFNPFSYLTGLARITQAHGTIIYEETPALNINYFGNGKIQVLTPRGTIIADKIVMAGNAYQGNLLPKLRQKYILVRTSMLATNILDKDTYDKIVPCNHAVFEWQNLLSYYQKFSDGRLIFGGGDSPLFSNKREEQKAFKNIYNRMIKIFPVLEGTHPTHWWGGYLCVTKTQLPEIGRIDNRIFYALGYSGHGVVPSHMAARVIAGMITNDLEATKLAEKFKAPIIPFAGHMDAAIATLSIQWFKFKDFLN